MTANVNIEIAPQEQRAAHAERGAAVPADHRDVPGAEPGGPAGARARPWRTRRAATASAPASAVRAAARAARRTPARGCRRCRPAAAQDRCSSGRPGGRTGQQRPQATVAAGQERGPRGGAGGGNAGRPAQDGSGAQAQARRRRRQPGQGAGRGGGGRGGFDPNMTPEERRKRIEERMAQMTPEERERFQARMREGGGGRGGFGGGNREGGAGAGRSATATAAPGKVPAAQTAAQAGNRQGGAHRPAGRHPRDGTGRHDDRLAVRPAAGHREPRHGLAIREQAAQGLRLRLGVSDGTFTEVLNESDVPANAEVVTSMTTGLEQRNTNQNQRQQSADGPAARAARTRRSGRRRRRRRWRRWRSGPRLRSTPCPVISVKNLVKTYVVGEVTVRALRGCDFDVEPGEFVAVTGPSGSGKSTLMHILGCLDRPTSGNYFLDGKDVSKMSKDELARRAQPEDRLRLPGLQPAVAHDRARQRRAAAALQRQPEAQDRRAAQAGDGRARGGRPGHASPPLPEPVVGRPAAARRHRARADQRSRRSSWPTSRPATSTRAPASRSWASSSGSTSSAASPSS